MINSVTYFQIGYTQSRQWESVSNNATFNFDIRNRNNNNKFERMVPIDKTDKALIRGFVTVKQCKTMATRERSKHTMAIVSSMLDPIQPQPVRERLSFCVPFLPSIESRLWWWCCRSTILAYWPQHTASFLSIYQLDCVQLECYPSHIQIKNQTFDIQILILLQIVLTWYSLRLQRPTWQ